MENSIDLGRILNEQVGDVFKLCEVIWNYVGETKSYKLDWSIISSSLPWNSRECQTIWKYIAYKWNPLDPRSEGMIVGNTEMYDDESDIEGEWLRMNNLMSTATNTTNQPN